MPRALDGITVVDISDGVAGGLATMMLCDNGARVIRIESPEGALERLERIYRMLNRGKESVFLDLATALANLDATVESAGPDNPLEVFRGLVEMADVLVDSYSPSSPYQALVDYNRLAASNPSLVRCSITAYGPDGPDRDEPALDDLVMARTGVLASQPSFRPGPVHVVHPIPSVGAAMLATQGTAAALVARESTGRGRHVNTSLMAGVLANSPMAKGESLKAWSGRQQRPTGDWPFYSVFKCQDGGWIQLGCIHDGFVSRTVDALGIREKLSGFKVGTRYAQPSEEDRAKVYDVVAEAFTTRPMAEWATALEEADVPYAPVLTMEDAQSDPQAKHNEMFLEVEDPELGHTTQAGLPVKLLATPGVVSGPAARPGEQTEAVLSEIRVNGARPRNDRATVPKTLDPPPLDGVKVLAIDNVIAGPWATRLLADLGADVVKLEPPAGEISRPSGSSQFSAFNSNKRCVAVNGKETEGRELVQKLAAWADVISENMRPGAAARIGLGQDDLTQLNPDVVYCHITGFGSEGPHSHRPGLDPLAQAMTGLQWAQAGPGNPPVYLGMLAPADYVGAMLGAVATVLALFSRARTGVGQRAETCLLNSGILMAFMGLDRRGDHGQYGRHALSRLYETKEGWLYLVAESEQEWVALYSVLGRADLRDDARFSTSTARHDNDVALAKEIEQALSERGAEEWVTALKQVSVPCATAVERYDVGFFSDPQAIANRMISVHDGSSLGAVKFSTRLVGFSDTEEPASWVTPLLGTHNREVLGQLGYSKDQVEELYRKNIVNTDEGKTKD